MRDELALMISWARAERRTALAELLEELRRARERLAELEGSAYLVRGQWEGDQLDGVALESDETGAPPPVDLELDASGLVAEVRRRQARDWVRAHEDGEGALEQLLALVPADLDLLVLGPAGSRSLPLANWIVSWQREGLTTHQAQGSTPGAAIRAATLALLGLDVPTAEPLATGAEFVAGAKAALNGGLELHGDMGSCLSCGSRDCVCSDGEGLATGDTEPPATQPSIGVGVEQEGNLIRAGGDEVDDAD